VNTKAVCVVISKLLLSLLFAVIVGSWPCLAQTTDVEVEVAGPWSYVADPSDGHRVIVIAPHSSHSVAIFSGQDASQYKSAPHNPVSGLHRLEFTPAPCGAHPDSYTKLYPVAVKDDPGDSDVDSAIGAKGNRYAVSVPKPCYYESYAESRSKVSPNGITPQTTDANYTTWMILHYKVKGTMPAPASLIEKPDVGVQGSSPVDFSSNVNNSNTKAISIVIFLDEDPDRKCDQQSADVFDQTTDLLNLKRLNRLFPELDYDPQHPKQTARYNRRCSPIAAEPRQGTDGALAQATVKGDSHEMRKDHDRKAPGRADCHAAQINVNGAVK
jgi:hypothetical protein